MHKTYIVIVRKIGHTSKFSWFGIGVEANSKEDAEAKAKAQDYEVKQVM